MIGTPDDTNAVALIQSNYYTSLGEGIAMRPADYIPVWKPTEGVVGGTFNGSYNYGNRSGATQVVGQTKAANNIPPYIAFNFWRKIAD